MVEVVRHNTTMKATAIRRAGIKLTERGMPRLHFSNGARGAVGGAEGAEGGITKNRDILANVGNAWGSWSPLFVPAWGSTSLSAADESPGMELTGHAIFSFEEMVFGHKQAKEQEKQVFAKV